MFKFNKTILQEFALTAIVISSIVTFREVLLGLYLKAFILCIVTISHVFAFYFIRKESFNTALVFLLIFANTGIFVLSSGEDGYSTAIFYIVTAMVSTSFFWTARIYFDWVFIIIPFLLYVVGRYSRFEILMEPDLPSYATELITITDFTVTFFASIFVMKFILKGYFNELSERKKDAKKLNERNELLIKTNEELDRFVYSASHDLRAPLSSISGLVNVARKSSLTPEVKNILDMIEGRVSKLDSFIKDIINYSRNSRTNIEVSEFFLRPEIEEILEDSRFMIVVNNMEVKIRCPDNLSIKTDRGRLQIVLNNLIINAFKYADATKKNPYVVLSASIKANTCVIKVCDNGIGIHRDHQPKIFNMFHRATLKSQGSGLGLYIVKETIDRLGGNINVISKEGKGSVFSIYFPVVDVSLPEPNYSLAR